MASLEPGAVALPNTLTSIKFAVIGDSGHAASIGLHASLGFLRVGTLVGCFAKRRFSKLGN